MKQNKRNCSVHRGQGSWLRASSTLFQVREDWRAARELEDGVAKAIEEYSLGLGDGSALSVDRSLEALMFSSQHLCSS